MANEQSTGFEPYISDGTKQGTFLLGDIFVGKENSYPDHFVEFNGLIHFLARSDSPHKKLWHSDGSKQGTVLSLDKIVLNDLARINDLLILDIFDNQYGTEPWIYDGDTATLLKDINPNSGSHPSLSNIEFQGFLYFTADDGVHGRELWKTDGTTEGTTLLKDIVSGPGSSSSSGLAVFDSFFLFTSGFLGHDELFISDGTTDGTHLLKDIYPGNPSSNAIGFFKFRDQIFFRASDYCGSELWKTDGTYSGTVIVKDINPSGSSYPQNSSKYRINWSLQQPIT